MLLSNKKREIIVGGRVLGVRSCYDEGKRTAETLTMDYHRGAGVEVGTNPTIIIFNRIY